MASFGDVYEYKDGARIMVVGVVGPHGAAGWVTTVVLVPGFVMAGLHSGMLSRVTSMALRTRGWTKLADGPGDYRAAVLTESPVGYWPLSTALETT